MSVYTFISYFNLVFYLIMTVFYVWYYFVNRILKLEHVHSFAICVHFWVFE